jgi:hypothetical protein
VSFVQSVCGVQLLVAVENLSTYPFVGLPNDTSLKLARVFATGPHLELLVENFSTYPFVGLPV